MKKIIFIITSFFLMSGCLNNGSHKESKDSSDEFEFVSQRHLNDKKFRDYNFKNEQDWDSLNNFSSQDSLGYKKGKVTSKFRTFGWHLYSNGSVWKNYNFPMLWGVSYFSYSVQPETGSYKSIHQWKTTALIDTAKANNCKVFLSVSNFGGPNNSVFLKNSQAHKTLIDSLSNLLALRNADGINIDFEGVLKEDENNFTKFIVKISKELKRMNPNYMISLCLYARDWDNIFDFKTIDSHIDFYTLMGYDYYGSFSKETGPVTPFKKSEKFGNGLKVSVNTYKDKGVNLSKLIVGLPYYGAEWYTKNPEIGTVVTRFKSHPPYNSIMDYYIDSLGIATQFDSKSISSYIVVKDSLDHYRQLFFEDVKSLSIKYDWIKDNKIGGVGIWALGYDNGRKELWNLLSEKFSQE